VGTRERRTDRGAERGRRLIREVGHELRVERRKLALSAAAVAQAAQCSPSLVTRVERAEVAGVSVDLLARVAAVLGLDLSVKLFPGGPAIRDRGQLSLAAAFRSHLHPSLGWTTEVPLPIVGDRRAWDGMVSGRGWRYGVEFESAPSDAQAITRRLQIKERDGGVDGALLVVPDTHRARDFVRMLAPLAGDTFPVASRDALARLRSGEDPGGSALVIVRRPSRRATAGA
jgi:transcriptional regulator with XRE-family HTH domain